MWRPQREAVRSDGVLRHVASPRVCSREESFIIIIDEGREGAPYAALAAPAIPPRLLGLELKRDLFSINRKVRKGDPLFTALLKNIFRSLEWVEYGININGSHLNHLRFADDLILIEENPSKLKMVQGNMDPKSGYGRMIYVLHWDHIRQELEETYAKMY
ncbi:hypothetical protein EVAR_39337_1 [Eumeta japonica]|uniref:Retrovirus-related Pol polyprotein from type-1 retrotransposable element R2 n=1 Tax=Eumeta variegata TaxID=151549 RepID=A0A4C1WR63_EUMVA|nr:hypothetical protein EVAR_39337_1 [Eumeta japonica]